MKPHIASIINSIVLIVFGLWGYLVSETPSLTSFIPVITGIILLILFPGFKKGNKVIAHITVGLTLLILIGLIKPLIGAIGRSDNGAILRVIIMMLSSITAMYFFVKSLIDVRR